MFKNMGGLGDMAKMMKSAQEIQEKMGRVQEEIAEMRVSGEAGGGLVKAEVTGAGELKKLDIDPSIFRPDDKEVVEDLIVAAVKDARGQAEGRAKAKMSELTAGMPLPEGFKFPF